MDRRKFVKSSLLTMGSLSLPPVLEAAVPGSKGPGGSTESVKFKIEYIRNDVPHFEIPPYRGASYEDKVPDTLDIAERAKLGIKWESDRGKDVPSAPWYRAYPVVSQAY